MANVPNYQERPIFTTSPILEHEQAGNESYYHEEEASSSSGCSSCFRFFSPGYWQPNSGTEARSLLNQTTRKENWVAERLKEAKEYSELVAGPKWKNIVRKVGAYIRSKKNQRQFQYDADSYALNFDCGLDSEEHDGLYHNGSSRFPPTPPVDAIRNLR